MIQNEKPTDPLDQKTGTDTVEDPPPYSKRQPSTSGNRIRPHNANINTNSNSGRFVAPAPAPSQRPSHSPLPSPKVIVSYSEQDPRAASFTDFANEKPASPKTGMYPDYPGNSALYPPYLAGASGASAAGSSFSVPSTSAESSAFPPRSPTTLSNKRGIDTLIMMGTGTSGNWLNHVVVTKKSDDVKYNCDIDPTLAVQDFATAQRTANLGRKAHSRSTSNISTSSSKSGKKKVDYSWHPSTAPEACHGYFETKSGKVDLIFNIGIAPGNVYGAPRSPTAGKANVDVRAKNGKVSVKIVDIKEGRRINLDVATVKGDIEVFVPRAFSGPLHVHTDGEITLLPRIAASMEVITAREDDALVMITPPKSTPSPSPSPSSSRSHQNHHQQQQQQYNDSTYPGTPGMYGMPGGFSNWLHPTATGGPRTPTYEGDHANLVSSSGGNIIVGFIGEDNIKEESPGMWKKIVRLFTGRSNSA